MKNVLVTGGAGYIGSHVCKHLAQAGFRPVTYDNLSNGHRDAVKWGPFQLGDIRDTDLVIKTMESFEIDSVLHLAALCDVGESIRYPQKFYENNVGGSLSVLRAMKECAVDKIVFSSSCAVYGHPQELPLREDHPFNPINPYGEGKLLVEREIAERAAKMNSITLRYFNAAGADLSGEIGEHRKQETHLIPLALMAILNQGPPLTIFGNDYETEDGTCIRDYVHVTDLALANVAALKLLEKSKKMGVTFNIGSGVAHSNLQVINEIEKITGCRVPLQVGPRRPGDAANLRADGKRARERLNWSPQFSDLGTIIDTAWRWHSRKEKAKLSHAPSFA